MRLSVESAVLDDFAELGGPELVVAFARRRRHWQIVGDRAHHQQGLRSGRRGSARFLLLGLPFHGADRPYGLDGLRFALLLEFLRALAVVLVDALTRERLLEPVQELRGRIGLVVVLAVGEDGQLVEVFGEPRCGLGDVDKAVLDHRGLRVQAHDLVAGRLVARDAMAALGDQLLDQLGARGLVLDQHDARIEQVAAARARRA